MSLQLREAYVVRETQAAGLWQQIVRTAVIRQDGVRTTPPGLSNAVLSEASAERLHPNGVMSCVFRRRPSSVVLYEA